MRLPLTLSMTFAKRTSLFVVICVRHEHVAVINYFIRSVFAWSDLFYMGNVCCLLVMYMSHVICIVYVY